MIDVARWLRVRYVEDGRDESGADCLGLALLIQDAHGRSIPAPEGVGVAGGAVPDAWWTYWSPIALADVRELDVIQTESRHRGVVTVLDARRGLTTRAETGPCVLRLDALRRSGRILGAYRAR